MTNLTLIAIREGATSLSAAEKEAITLARGIGGVAAILSASESETLVRECELFGCSEVLLPSTTLTQHGIAAYADSIATLIKNYRPTIVMMADSPDAKEILGRVAVLTKSPIFTNVSDIRAHEFSHLEIVQEVLGGSTTVVSEVRAATTLVTWQASSIVAFSSPTTAHIETFTHSVAQSTQRTTRIPGPRSATTSWPAVTEARIIVAAGRGVGEQQDFEELVIPLADILHAAVGASRAAIDNEWCDRENLIGQSGHTVSPEVYIALGISGAIHHRAGMQNAKHVIAINTDPDAPMVTTADLGVVGDVRQIIPNLIQRLRAFSS